MKNIVSLGKVLALVMLFCSPLVASAQTNMEEWVVKQAMEAREAAEKEAAARAGDGKDDEAPVEPGKDVEEGKDDKVPVEPGKEVEPGKDDKVPVEPGKEVDNGKDIVAAEPVRGSTDGHSGGNDVPLDGGLSFLLAAGAAYGVKLHTSKKKKKTLSIK